MALKVGGLFSGIGGLELGLERAGMEIAWHCESEEFCRRILEQRWPGVPCYEDVCTLAGGMVEPVDVLCGGFPCQDISLAGRGAGIDGARSGLWAEYARLISELRPRYALMENVSALLGRGLDRVLGDLAALGYDAEWDCLPASAFGAPHRRDRVWILAYPSRESANISLRSTIPGAEGRDQLGVSGGGSGGGGAAANQGWAVDYAVCGRHGPPEGQVLARGDGPVGTGWWAIEPDVGRVANGVPARVDRLRSLGNAVVPQIPEWIGRRIIEWEAVNAA